MPCSKRQRADPNEEKERKRQQNLKDQRAYRARVKVGALDRRVRAAQNTM